jgi:hypothetical protein
MPVSIVSGFDLRLFKVAMRDNDELITQTAAAQLRGMTLAAVNEHVRSGNWRSEIRYGKRLVVRADVVNWKPMTHKKKHGRVK